MKLLSISDADNNPTILSYENSSFTNQVTKVTDPFGRYCQLGYDSQGYLNSITDGIGLATSLHL